MKGETEISYADYFRSEYQKTIRDTEQPLLINKNIRTGASIVLLPELCKLCGLTEAMK
jgi:hypothetical protein